VDDGKDIVGNDDDERVETTLLICHSEKMMRIGMLYAVGVEEP
jgi:hypothetical protein